MIFRMYECEFGFKYNGIDYSFTNVMSLQIEDNEVTRLTRGANGKNVSGLIYKEGITEPKRWTVTIRDMTPEIKALLDTVYKDQERVDVYCISEATGSSKIAKNAILSQLPQQLLVDESPDSMNVALMFETFDSGEVFKA
jgi:hypothetical protein